MTTDFPIPANIAELTKAYQEPATDMPELITKTRPLGRVVSTLNTPYGTSRRKGTMLSGALSGDTGSLEAVTATPRMLISGT